MYEKERQKVLKEKKKQFKRKKNIVLKKIFRKSTLHKK